MIGKLSEHFGNTPLPLVVARQHQAAAGRDRQQFGSIAVDFAMQTEFEALARLLGAGAGRSIDDVQSMCLFHGPNNGGNQDLYQLGITTKLDL